MGHARRILFSLASAVAVLAGNHTATVTAHDLDSLTATSSASVLVRPFDPCGGGVVGVNCGPSALTVLSGLAVRPNTFRAASSGPATTAAKKKPTGATISYTDSQGVRATFTVLQPRSGVRSGRLCARPPRQRHGKKLKRCTRLVVLGSFTHADALGSNHFHFTGRVGGRKLAPGSYQLRATAGSGAQASTRVSRAFKIIR